MAIIHTIDLGAHPTWGIPIQTQKGQIARLKTQTAQNRGGKEFFYMEGAEFPERSETVWVTGTTPAATLLLVNQLLELVGNPDINKPCYIQWASGGGLTVADPQDGWYFITSAEPDTEFSWTTYLPVKLSVRKASSAGLRSAGISMSGGALSTAYIGGSTNWVTYPTNATNPFSNYFRTGAEGPMPFVLSPLINPSPFTSPSAIDDLFKGGCRVFDTMQVGGNPVPTVATANKVIWPNGLTGTSFEAATDGWISNNVGSGTSNPNDTGNTHSGTKNLTLTNPSVGNYGGTFNKFGVPVANLSSILIDGWVKGSAGGTTGPLRVTFANPGSFVSVAGVASAQPSAQASVAVFDLNPTVTTSYGEFNQIIYVPSGYQYAFVEIYANGNGTPATAWWDDVSISNPFTEADWVEVFGVDHKFIGDTIVTNGLLMLQVQQLGAYVNLYLWNWALATPAWQQVTGFSPLYSDNAGNLGVPQQIEILRLGLEEVSLQVLEVTTAGKAANLLLRLQRGACYCRIDFRPLTESSITNTNVFIDGPVSTKFVYITSNIADPSVDGAGFGLTPGNGYGYAAQFAPTSTQPYIVGLLWQTSPTYQPWIINTTGRIGVGDPASTPRAYGIFAVPFANIQNLQAEAELGGFGAGFSVVNPDAAASNAQSLKAASGTASGVVATFGAGGNSSFLWPTSYALFDVWFRVRVASAASSTAQMKFGIWDVTAGVYSVSTTYAPNALLTTYVYVRPANNWNPNSFTHLFQFKAETTATLGTDWFIDEAVIVPKSATANATANMPQDIWQQFSFDRTTEIIQD